jgi:hypothetical protein
LDLSGGMGYPAGGLEATTTSIKNLRVRPVWFPETRIASYSGFTKVIYLARNMRIFPGT